MAGSLWRQRPDEEEARQLTDGPGYDYQPDWSPDGRRVVYASYHDDAIELRLLDLASGESVPLVANGAVNIEPRWSPDGGRIAFTSSLHQGLWHVFVVPVGPHGATGEPTRLTPERDSGLPRYYYHRKDQYFSPAWSPDGRELILMSNRGRIWGSGGFWRVEARPNGRGREIHYEETTWKARPDWSRDGRRVVYSSYLGRQWNQLWLMTSEGGDPLQLTYGEFDATAPRWSPAGDHIAYVSNEGGNTSLRVIELPGGSRKEIRTERRHPLRPSGILRIAVAGSGGSTLPARISVRGEDGRSHAPTDAWQHADDAFDRAERPFEYGYFHTSGSSTLRLPAGRYSVEISRGPEYHVADRTVAGDGGRRTSLRVSLPAGRRPGGPRLVQRRSPRPHELRRHLPQRPEATRVPGPGGGSPRRREPHREQGGPRAGRRLLPVRSRSRIDIRHPDRSRRGIPHQLLGSCRTARPPRAPGSARLHRVRQHRRRQPPADERPGIRPRAGHRAPSPAMCTRTTCSPIPPTPRVRSPTSCRWISPWARWTTTKLWDSWTT